MKAPVPWGGSAGSHSPTFLFLLPRPRGREAISLQGCGLYEPPFPCCSQRRAQVLFSGTSLIARRGAGTRGVFSPGLLGVLHHF